MSYLVQSKSATGTSLTTLTVTLNSNTTAGNCLIVCVTSTAATNPAVTGITLGGAAGNFAVSASAGSGGSSSIGTIWADPNCTGGQTSVVITLAGGSGTATVLAEVMEWSGLVTSGVVDRTSATGPATSTGSWTSGNTLTTTQPLEVAIGMTGATVSGAGLTGPGSPWYTLAQVNSGAGSTSMLTGYQYLTQPATAVWSGGNTPPLPALVQSAQVAAGAVTTVTVTLPHTATAGNCLIVSVITNSSANAPSATGITLGGSADNFAQASTVGNAAGIILSFWTDQNCAGGSTAVVASVSGGTGTWGVSVTVEEWSGILHSGAVDQTVVNGQTTGGTWTSNSTGQPQQLIEVAFGAVAYADLAASPTINGPSGPWTNLTQLDNPITTSFLNTLNGYNILTNGAATAYAGTLTGNAADAYVAGVITLRAATGAGGYNALIATFSEASPAAAALTGAWYGSASRNPVAFVNEPPPLTPLAIPVTNTAGQWLIAVATWRQDAGITGAIQYPSTVTISDDAGNFWIPVQAGRPALAASTTPVTGVARTSVWMAPAARQAQFVFASATSYQAGLVVQIFQFSGASPWYQVQVTNSGFSNQATSLAVSGVVYPNNVFTFGVLGWDNVNVPMTISSTGWQALSQLQTTNPANRAGDIVQAPFTITGTGAAATLSATAGALSSMTVTATASVNTLPGITLAVRVVTGAQISAAQINNAGINAAGTVSTGSPSTTQLTITPNGQQSLLYMSMIEGPVHTPYTPLASTTFIYNTGDATNNIIPGIAKGSSLSTAGSPVTLGASAPTSGNFFGAIAEILATAGGPGIAEDGSTPAVANVTGGVTVTSASFTPPAGSLLVAMIASNGPSSSQLTTMTVTDSGNRTWTKIAVSSQNPQLASIWVADASPVDLAATVVSVSGINDARAFPYGTPALENWPVLVTEIADGATLNADPVFAQGTANWAPDAGSALAAVSQPLFQPIPVTYQPSLFGAVRVTPSGSGSFGQSFVQGAAFTPVSATTQYTAIAYAYSPSGWPLGAQVFISWYSAASSGSFISSSYSTLTPLQPGEWTLLSLAPSTPPSNAAFAQTGVREFNVTGTGSIPANAVFYVGYCAFSAAVGYQFAPPDQLTWTDISSRVFTHGQVDITRGIQYEQQSLEAGTMTIYIANNDGVITFGNVISPYWPAIGDTDVPIRLRAVWPGSLTPYSPLFTGFTDETDYGVDSGTYYGFAQLRSSDAWSRLTQQMLSLVAQEVLYDGPVAFIPCNQTGANIVAGTAFTSTPAVSLLNPNSFANVPLPATLPTATFTGSGVSLPGAPGQSCWEVTGTRASQVDGEFGISLLWTPFTASLPLAAGITLEFWYSPVSVAATQPSPANPAVCSAISSAGNPFWLLYINNSGAASATFMNLIVFNPFGFQIRTVQVGTIPFYQTGFSSLSYYIVVNFNQSNITVTVNPGGTLTASATLSGLNMPAFCTGFAWNGVFSGTTTTGDIAIADIAIYNKLIPAARSMAHYLAGSTAFSGELDTWRLARVAGYSGFIPVLGMRGTDLPAAGSADVDIVTGATDTNTQVVSAYFTNVAASTLAGMFVNGAGTLIYRRRQEWYNRPIGQYVLGENDSQFLSLGFNPLNTLASTAGWTTGNAATLTTSVALAGGPLFFPFTGVFHGNGATANPFIITNSNPAVSPGSFYEFTTWLYSPQGWTSGINAQIQFFNASNVQVGTTQSSPTVQLAAGSIGYTTVGPVQAPSTAAYIKVLVQVTGTPASSVLFYVAAAQAFLVTPDYAGGAGANIAEAAYHADYQLDSDRAQLFNYAVLTQYGTNQVASFSGTSVLFTPSSGITVIISNVPSIALRGQIPYTATVYLNNTIQASPYNINEGSIEDIANWVTQTLGAPLLRVGSVTLTPVATQSSLSTGLTADVGDTMTFRRRPLGSPVTQVQAYYSKLAQSIDVSGGQWTVRLELSPFPQGSVLTCDDVVHGVLTGQNLLGW